jgi:putative chitinase
VSPELLRACVGRGSTPERMAWLAPKFTAAMTEFKIESPAAQAMFLAQVGHESGGLQWLREIWGPTDAQKRYEPPSSLAAKLGNTQKGDGRRFMGRGPIQITGRFNYVKFGPLLGLDLVAKPELLEDAMHGIRAACAFWNDRNLTPLAEAGKIITVTKRINGGENGLADRQARWEAAKIAMKVTT